MEFNCLPNDKILNWSKLKVFANSKLNVTEKLKYAFGRVENIVGKGENADYQHFLLFQQYFQNASYTMVLKVDIVWFELNLFMIFWMKLNKILAFISILCSIGFLWRNLLVSSLKIFQWKK